LYRERLYEKHPAIEVTNHGIAASKTNTAIPATARHRAHFFSLSMSNRFHTAITTQAENIAAAIRKMAGKYSRESLQAALSSALEDAYEKGKTGGKNGISETLYRAINRPAH
jgi:hypothetical protein